MIQVNFINQQGYKDVSVTTKSITFASDYGWVDPNPALAAVTLRNVGFFPLRLKNGGSTEVVGPNLTDNPLAFVYSTMAPGIPAIKDFVKFTIMTANDDVIKEVTLAVPFAGLVKSGVARIAPNEVVYAHLNLGLVDKSGIPNRGMNAMYYVMCEIDPYNQWPGFYCNIVVPARFYSNQIRHSEDLDIL